MDEVMQFVFNDKNSKLSVTTENAEDELRVARHNDTALELAKRLEEHPKVFVCGGGGGGGGGEGTMCVMDTGSGREREREEV